MKHRAFTLLEVVVVVLILAILAAILFPVFAPRWDSQKPPCTFNLKQIGMGFLQYTQDYDGKFPPVDNGSSIMNAALTPYIGEDESNLIFQCSSTWGNDIGRTDYFYNAQLAGANKTKITRASATILSGDGEDDHLTLQYLKQLPDAWRENEGSPAYRHLDGANYAFADGHVKWLRPEQITLDKPALGKPTFLVKP